MEGDQEGGREGKTTRRAAVGCLPAGPFGRSPAGGYRWSHSAAIRPSAIDRVNIVCRKAVGYRQGQSSTAGRCLTAGPFARNPAVAYCGALSAERSLPTGEAQFGRCLRRGHLAAIRPSAGLILSAERPSAIGRANLPQQTVPYGEAIRPQQAVDLSAWSYIRSPADGYRRGHSAAILLSAIGGGYSAAIRPSPIGGAIRPPPYRASPFRRSRAGPRCAPCAGRTRRRLPD